MEEVSLKFCIVGESGVGKSAIINRLVNNSFNEQMDITVGCTVAHHNLNVNNRPVRMQIWDVGGGDLVRESVQNFWQGRLLFFRFGTSEINLVRYSMLAVFLEPQHLHQFV